MGVALPSDAVPVGRATNCIIAATGEEVRQDIEAMPCIRCGNCSDVCPAYLMPQELFRAAEHDQFETLEDLGLFDCIECGCCDVVCPSQIPLTDSFRAAKRRLVQSMDHASRVRWLDDREQLRRHRVERWEHAHSEASTRSRPRSEQRLEALADVVARLGRSSEATETAWGTEETNA